MATSRYLADRGRDMASPRPKTRDSKDTLCRNVLIYGHCRYEDQGCAFNHEQNKGKFDGGMLKKSLNVDSPSFTPATLQPASKSKSTFSSQALNAAPFTPKATGHSAVTPIINQNGESSVFNPAASREFVPSTTHNNYDLATAAATNGITADTTVSFDGYAMSAMNQALPSAQYHQYVDEHNALGATSATFYPTQAGYTAPTQPLMYHLYAPVGPYRKDLEHPHQRAPRDFFLKDDIREDLHKKSEAARQVLANTQLPPIGHYHSLVPLDEPSKHSGTFGKFQSWVYKTISKKNGHIYCLRRLVGHRLNSSELMKIVGSWKSINNGNVATLIDFFTSREFTDNSIIFIFNYYPCSKTLQEHHFSPNVGRSYSRPTPVPESVLWSYICQVTNALKAIHFKGLAARCIDLTKVILTDKNRIRLSACSMLDVLDYESPKPLEDLQQEDFLHLGRLILSIGLLNQPISSPQTNISQGLVDQFGRTYSAELKDRVLWLLTPPTTPEQLSQKNVLELACGLSNRILDSFDSSFHANDEMTSALMRELENGRVARLALKLGVINERPEYDGDSNWSETGERYQLKLFRDYVFHQVDSNGNPVLDLGHMLSCLNKLDAGVDEKIHLTSRDNQTSFVVSYKELKKMAVTSFNELMRKPNTHIGSKQPLNRAF